MLAKHFTETSNKVKLRINHVRINHAQPVLDFRIFRIITLFRFSKYGAQEKTYVSLENTMKFEV